MEFRSNLIPVVKRLAMSALMAVLVVSISGCGLATPPTPGSNPPPTGGTFNFAGRARGGQQPISGAYVELYEAAAYGTPGSYGGVAQPVYMGGTSTDANGNFTLTNELECDGNMLTYLLVLYGDPGIGSNNQNIAEMAALGSCETLTSNTYIEVNELTTVASVYALALFMNGSPYISSTITNLIGMTHAFTDVNQLTDTSTGTIPGPTLPPGSIFPTAKFNTLADIIAACINSAGGAAGDNSPCGNLFLAATPPGGTAPIDTVTALSYIAQNPANNVTALFNLVTAQAVYVPTLAKPPNDWLLAVKYQPAGASAPSAIAADGSANIWVTNKRGNNLLELSRAGAVEATVSNGFNAPAALAIDLSGNVWVAQSGNSSVSYVLLNGSLGTGATSGTGNLDLPASIAVDPAGNVWVADAGANTVTVLNSSGVPVISGGYSGSGIVRPLGLAISPHE